MNSEPNQEFPRGDMPHETGLPPFWRSGRLAGWWDVLATRIAHHPLITRWLLAGPGALIASLAIIAAAPLWLPTGPAEIDNIVYPLILAPLIWAIVFIYTCLEENLPRGVLVIVVGSVVQGAAAALALFGVISGHTS